MGANHPRRQSSAIASALASCVLFASSVVFIVPAVEAVWQGAATTAIEDLDEAILRDLIRSYATYHDESSAGRCANGPNVTFSFDMPGETSGPWDAKKTQFESMLFLASMSYRDPIDDVRSWSMRIGTGGNVYSLRYHNAHGETIPPQKNVDAPWIDEVLQSVSVPLQLNDRSNCFVHQAGAYARDGAYTNATPAFSPNMAKYCSGNYCAFASWGTQALVPNNYTSPILYVNRYANCGNGTIEHTLMIHK
jgi:hypothetical protein